MINVVIICILHIMLGFQRGCPSTCIAHARIGATHYMRLIVIIYSAHGASAIVLRFVVQPSTGGSMRSSIFVIDVLANIANRIVKMFVCSVFPLLISVGTGAVFLIARGALIPMLSAIVLRIAAMSRHFRAGFTAGIANQPVVRAVGTILLLGIYMFVRIS